MMAETNHSLTHLEENRQRLEQTIAKTRAVLKEWKQWQQEYSFLKEEINAMPPDAPQSWMETARESFEGQLVDEDELTKIFGEGNKQKRDQVLSVLVNRLDYVRRNIATLQKRIEKTEKEMGTVATVEDSEDAEDEYIPEDTEFSGDEGNLPVTEILEELDEDDNVVSYSLRTPGSNQPQLLETLEKAGLKEISPAHNAPSKKPSERDPDLEGHSQPQVENKPSAQGRVPSNTKAKKRSVKFTEDTKPANDAAPTKASKSTRVVRSSMEQPEYMTFSASQIEELMREAKLQETIISDPVVPADESEEDAQLRRDMLQYNLSELNPVVAELTLEEGGLTDEDGDYWDDDDDDNDDYDDNEDDEDRWGRSKSSAINEEYRQKMLEIQQRLQHHSFDSLAAPDGSDDDHEVRQEGIATIRVKNEELAADGGSQPATSALKSDTALETQKSVRFASALDIAERPASIPAAAATSQQQRSEVDPLADEILERQSNAVKPTSTPVVKKASRFKMARDEAASRQSPSFKAPVAIDGSIINPELPISGQQFAPSGPEGQTIAASVLERAPSEKPREPDEFNADMLKQQAAVEYHKVRNRLIQKQGGFMKEDESPIQPLDEEEGGPKRMSRFKAARLAKS